MKWSNDFKACLHNIRLHCADLLLSLINHQAENAEETIQHDYSACNQIINQIKNSKQLTREQNSQAEIYSLIDIVHNKGNIRWAQEHDQYSILHQQLLSIIYLCGEMMADISILDQKKIRKIFTLIDGGNSTWIPAVDPLYPEFSHQLFVILTKEFSKIGEIDQHFQLGFIEKKGYIAFSTQYNPNTIFNDLKNAISAEDTSTQFILNNLKSLNNTIAYANQTSKISQDYTTIYPDHITLTSSYIKSKTEILKFLHNSTEELKHIPFITWTLTNNAKALISLIKGDAIQGPKSKDETLLNFLPHTSRGSAGQIIQLLDYEMNFYANVYAQDPNLDQLPNWELFDYFKDSIDYSAATTLKNELVDIMDKFISAATQYDGNTAKKNLLNELIADIRPIQEYLRELNQFNYTDHTLPAIEQLLNQVPWLQQYASTKPTDRICQYTSTQVLLNLIYGHLIYARDRHHEILNRMLAGKTGAMIDQCITQLELLFNKINYTNDTGSIVLLDYYQQKHASLVKDITPQIEIARQQHSVLLSYVESLSTVPSQNMNYDEIHTQISQILAGIDSNSSYVFNILRDGIQLPENINFSQSQWKDEFTNTLTNNLICDKIFAEINQIFQQENIYNFENKITAINDLITKNTINNIFPTLKKKMATNELFAPCCTSSLKLDQFKLALIKLKIDSTINNLKTNFSQITESSQIEELFTTIDVSMTGIDAASLEAKNYFRDAFHGNYPENALPDDSAQWSEILKQIAHTIYHSKIVPPVQKTPLELAEQDMLHAQAVSDKIINDLQAINPNNPNSLIEKIKKEFANIIHQVSNLQTEAAKNLFKQKIHRAIVGRGGQFTHSDWENNITSLDAVVGRIYRTRMAKGNVPKPQLETGLNQVETAQQQEISRAQNVAMTVIKHLDQINESETPGFFNLDQSRSENEKFIAVTIMQTNTWSCAAKDEFCQALNPIITLFDQNNRLDENNSNAWQATLETTAATIFTLKQESKQQQAELTRQAEQRRVESVHKQQAIEHRQQQEVEQRQQQIAAQQRLRARETVYNQQQADLAITVVDGIFDRFNPSKLNHVHSSSSNHVLNSKTALKTAIKQLSSPQAKAIFKNYYTINKKIAISDNHENWSDELSLHAEIKRLNNIITLENRKLNNREIIELCAFIEFADLSSPNVLQAIVVSINSCLQQPTLPAVTKAHLLDLETTCQHKLYQNIYSSPEHTEQPMMYSIINKINYFITEYYNVPQDDSFITTNTRDKKHMKNIYNIIQQDIPVSDQLCNIHQLALATKSETKVSKWFIKNNSMQTLFLSLLRNITINTFTDLQTLDDALSRINSQLAPINNDQREVNDASRNGAKNTVFQLRTEIKQ